MKRYYYLIIIFAIALLQACTQETDLIFDKPASERMQETLDRYEKLLSSNTKGWLMEYYPQQSRSYGGYNMYYLFDDGEVTVKSEVESTLLKVDEATSVYRLGQDMGPTLNFDTYNEILNFFSDPALEVGGGAGLGFEGDYEFVFMSGNESEIILRGKKTKNIIRMTPFTGSSWDVYRDAIKDMRDAVSASQYSMVVNGKTVNVEKSAYDYFTFSYDKDENEKMTTVGMSYIVTSKGIKLYEPLTINGVTMQEFTYNAASEKMLSADGKAEISLVILPVADQFVNSLSTTEWFMSSTAMGSVYFGLFDAMKTGMRNFGYPVAYAWIGSSVVSGEPSFSYHGYYQQLYPSSELLIVKKVDGVEDQITITTTGIYEKFADQFAALIPSVQPFVNSLAGTFVVTTIDPLKRVNNVTLTDPSNANRTYTLTLDEVVFP